MKGLALLATVVLAVAFVLVPGGKAQKRHDGKLPLPEFRNCVRGCFESFKTCFLTVKPLYRDFKKNVGTIVRKLKRCCKGGEKDKDKLPANYSFATCVWQTCKGEKWGCKHRKLHEGYKAD